MVQIKRIGVMISRHKYTWNKLSKINLHDMHKYEFLEILKNKITC